MVGVQLQTLEVAAGNQTDDSTVPDQRHVSEATLHHHTQGLEPMRLPDDWRPVAIMRIVTLLFLCDVLANHLPLRA